MKYFKVIAIILTILIINNIKSTVMHDLCRQNNLNQIRKLVLEKPEIINKTDIYNQSLIFTAIENNHEKIINFLLKQKNLNLNQTDKFTWTPLHWAVKLEQYDIVKALLNSQSDPNIQDAKGRTPLHLAIKSKKQNIIDLLLKHNDTDLNLRRSKLNTYMHYAIKEQNYHLTLYLIKTLGANNLLITNAENKNLIDLIIEQKNYKFINLLLNCWSLLDPKLKVKYNQEIIGLAFIYIDYLKNKYIDNYYKFSNIRHLIRNLLNQKNIDINHKYIILNKSMSLLELAILCQELKLVKKIIKNEKVSIILEDHDILFTAIWSENKEIIKTIAKKFPGLLIKKPNKQYKDYYYLDILVNKLSFNDMIKIINVDDIKVNTTLLMKIVYILAKNKKGVSIIKHLKDKGLNINVSGQLGTALHLATSKKNNAAITNLLDLGADINCKDILGNTPLQIATTLGKSKIIKNLIKRESLNINLKNKAGIKPINRAIIDSNSTVLDIFLKQDKHAVILDPLSIYLAANKLNTLETILKHLKKQNATIDTKGQDKTPALHLAIYDDNFTAAQNLLKNNANVNSQDSEGKTALIIASLKNNIRITKLLLDNGAYVNYQTKAGSSPLLLAVEKGYTNLAKLLISYGATTNILNKNKQTLLHLAISQKNIELFKELLNKYNNINHKDKFNYTPLMLACTLNNYEIVKELCKQKTLDVMVYFRHNSFKIEKFTALHMAILNNNSNIFAELIKYHSINNLSKKDKFNLKNYLINFAIEKDANNCCQYLIDNF